MTTPTHNPQEEKPVTQADTAIVDKLARIETRLEHLEKLEERRFLGWRGWIFLLAAFILGDLDWQDFRAAVTGKGSGDGE